MARAGHKIFDADTHLYESVEQIEAYLSAADRAKLDALAPRVRRERINDGIWRCRIGQRPREKQSFEDYYRLRTLKRPNRSIYARLCLIESVAQRTRSCLHRAIPGLQPGKLSTTFGLN